MATMTREQKKAATAEAWGEYRARAATLSADRRLGWADYLEADGRAWRTYLAAEREIAATPETKAA